MPDEFRYDVFLSHSTRDKPIVRDIAERLKKDGIKVWFDAWEIKPGASISAKVDEGLESSRVLVLFMSANAFGSDWALLESYSARFKDPLNKKLGFIPLRLDDAPIKRSLEQFRYIDWTVADTTQAYQELLESCRVEAASSHPTRYSRDFIPQPPAFYAEPDYIGSHKFIGRQAELDALSEWAKGTESADILIFEAIGGNGKSMLTWEWATKHATSVNVSWAGCFWYSFYERGAIMQDFCQRALAYMTGRPLKEFEQRKTAEMKDDILRLLRANPWLLILDGLERVLVAYHRIDAAEVPDEEVNSPTDKILSRNPCDAIRDEDNDLLRALTACAPSKILISSRLTPRVLLNSSGQSIPGVRLVILSGLCSLDAEKLLRACGIAGDSAAIQDYLKQNCDNHPLVIDVLAGLINDYLSDRGNFDAWSVDPVGGVGLDLEKLNLIQRRNHILRAALDALPDASRQLLYTLALVAAAMGYEAMLAINPHLPPELEAVEAPNPPEHSASWNFLSRREKEERIQEYQDALIMFHRYKEAKQARIDSIEYLEAPKKLSESVKDLESRNLLQYDSNSERYDIHPVVRGVAAYGMTSKHRENCGQRVLDHFSSRAHDPFAEADTLQGVSSGLHLVRTLVKLGRYQEVVKIFRGDFTLVILVNLEAWWEILSLLRPLFSSGWDKLPTLIWPSEGADLANIVAVALNLCGEHEQALASHKLALYSHIQRYDTTNTAIQLINICRFFKAQNSLSKSLRQAIIATDFAKAIEDQDILFVSQLDLFSQYSIVGNWQEANEMGKALDSLGHNWSRRRYRNGEAEYEMAQKRLWEGSLSDECLTAGMLAAKSGNNRPALRALHRLRGSWKLARREWAESVLNFQEAVRMARERRLIDAESEAGLALAKICLGQLDGDDAVNEAERLAQQRQVAHRYLAMLFLAIHDADRAKVHALDAYRWAWADGEPYVHRYELAETTALLQRMNVQVPELPPYDPAKDDPFPWEAEVCAMIERLNAVNGPKQGQ